MDLTETPLTLCPFSIITIEGIRATNKQNNELRAETCTSDRRYSLVPLVQDTSLYTDTEPYTYKGFVPTLLYCGRVPAANAPG